MGKIYIRLVRDIGDKDPIKTLLEAQKLCLFYAATDEFHQLFVPGRSAMFTDVVIDFSGAAMGTVLFYIGYYRVWIKRKQEYKTADKMTG
ncbi:MAG: VanZ family protein [Clostridiaceae bacterium]